MIYHERIIEALFNVLLVVLWGMAYMLIAATLVELVMFVSNAFFCTDWLLPSSYIMNCGGL